MSLDLPGADSERQGYEMRQRANIRASGRLEEA